MSYEQALLFSFAIQMVASADGKGEVERTLRTGEVISTRFADPSGAVLIFTWTSTTGGDLTVIEGARPVFTRHWPKK